MKNENEQRNMDRKVPLSVVILTFNEEKNIEACLKSIHGWAERIFIVDSFSTDKTLEIVARYTKDIYQNTWKNYESQLNWGLENLPIDTQWVMRLDSDETVTQELRDELSETLNNLDKDTTGLYVPRKVYFLGKWIKHGGYYPIRLLRIWRNKMAHCEKRWMDEHMKVSEGNLMVLKNDIIDDNKKNLHWWTGKHNDYATREAIDILNLSYKFLEYDSVDAELSGSQEKRKRWIKENFYVKMPLFVRPFFYFIYRYIFKLGFLDGKEGLIWHILQGFWYRFLVDVKIYEIKKKSDSEGIGVLDSIRELYGIDLEKKGKEN